MASSTKPQSLLNHRYTGANHAPPPTPSTEHPNCQSASISTTADIFSSLLHRLPPTLSLSPRESSPAVTCPPIISLSDESNSSLLLSAAELGYFQLVDHSISPQLARSAESDSGSIFNLADEQKQICVPKNWPIGFTVDGDEDDDGNGTGESLCLGSSSMTDSSLINLREFSREMEKIGLRVFEMLCGAIGLENPVKKDPTRIYCLTWVHEGCRSDRPAVRRRVYPYVIGLDYQIRKEKYSLLSDSGWVSVLAPVGSVLVTLGDIAQVWSNGKLGKVREKTVENLKEEMSGGIRISFLLTLPLDSIVSPQLPKVVADSDDSKAKNAEKLSSDLNEVQEIKYKSFPFEDYAWRVYHQRVFFKDPLCRYRIKAL